MSTAALHRTKKPLVKASDIMSEPVSSVFVKDTIRNVADLFLRKNISGVPVLGEDGYVVGVMTKTDLARYDKQRVEVLTRERERMPVALETGEGLSGFRLTAEDESIEQWFNPKVYWVQPEAPLAEVVQKMSRHHIHHLFVKAANSKNLIGVITTFDLLRSMEPLLRQLSD